ncbi:MAG: hypothetical protein ABIP78_06405, partial [Pyrinomonadaceae bacterium]
MKLINTTSDLKSLSFLASFLLLFCVAFSAVRVPAQSPEIVPQPFPAANPEPVSNTGFRVDRFSVAGGAEIITIFAKHSYHDGPMQGPVADIPLVSILRDTLGDNKVENDRLR